MARNGRRTRIVRMADRLKLSPGIIDSSNLKLPNSKSFFLIQILFIRTIRHNILTWNFFQFGIKYRSMNFLYS
jgi:hypothetical protein